MEEKSTRKIVKQLAVSSEIMKSSNLSIEELQSYLNHLGSVFGGRTKYIIPDKINDLSTLRWIANLSERIGKVEHFRGFDKHVKSYTRNQIQSSYFVTVIASYLVDNNIDNLIFDPPIIVTGKKPDLLIDFQGEQIYIECKMIDTKQFHYTEEHNQILSILRNYLDVPHQIDIRYKESMSEAELHQLGKVLHERLHQVKGNGKIINNENLEVQVQIRDKYLSKNVRLIMLSIMEDLNDKCSYPQHCYGLDGRSIAISGPKVDYSNILSSKIRRSRRQAPDNKPYVLMIQGNLMLGSLTENIRALSSAFQPKTNTRFSAGMLVTYYQRFDSSKLDFKFYFVPNPFAQYPVSKEFERLFSAS